MYSNIMVKKNTYYDSVTLMSIGSKVKALTGIDEAVVVMATDMNKEILAMVGLSNDDVQNAGQNDFIIAIRSDEEESYRAALEMLEEKLSKGEAASMGSQVVYNTIKQAAADFPDANVAVISVPGKYAAKEAMSALKNGIHVMMFSDNVTVEDEKRLKEYAASKGLLMMGPDCGTAALNSVGLCFANKVRKGNIGLIGASGTGLQEVMVQIDRLGGGVTQALGTGGRDLSEAVGGIMMLEGIKSLMEEPGTQVIGLISKPPAKSVEEKIFKLLEQTDKHVVVCFLEGDTSRNAKLNLHLCSNLFDAAKKAVELAGVCADRDQDYARLELLNEQVKQARQLLKPEQKYLRGLFCGGTLCAEALSIIRGRLGETRSNISHRKGEEMKGKDTCIGNVLLDMGDDEFTNGRPHPMIEPALRNDTIARQGSDATVGVILLDFEIGYGSHNDPVGETLGAIRAAKAAAKAQGRALVFVSYVCGTDKDKQSLAEQKTALLREGVILAASNMEAACIAADILV